jgi:hypothetical protein
MTYRRSKNKGRYKSLLERDFASHLAKRKLPADYEAKTFQYVRPSHYTPDWKIHDKLYLETKGEFASSQRANLVAFKAQHPDVEIILVFAEASNKLHKRAKMTYAEWADKNGFRYHDLQAVYNKKKKGYDIKNPIRKEYWPHE